MKITPKLGMIKMPNILKMMKHLAQKYLFRGPAADFWRLASFSRPCLQSQAGPVTVEDGTCPSRPLCYFADADS